MGAHPLPNTPSTQPAPRKGRGRNQRDLDKGWDQEREGEGKGAAITAGRNRSNLVHLPFDEKSGRLLPLWPSLALTGRGCVAKHCVKNIEALKGGECQM